MEIELNEAKMATTEDKASDVSNKIAKNHNSSGDPYSHTQFYQSSYPHAQETNGYGNDYYPNSRSVVDNHHIMMKSSHPTHYPRGESMDDYNRYYQEQGVSYYEGRSGQDMQQYSYHAPTERPTRGHDTQYYYEGRFQMNRCDRTDERFPHHDERTGN